MTEPPADPTPSPPIELNLSELLDLISGTWSPQILGVMMKILATNPKLQIILTVIIALVIAIVVYYKCKKNTSKCTFKTAWV